MARLLKDKHQIAYEIKGIAGFAVLAITISAGTWVLSKLIKKGR